MDFNGTVVNWVDERRFGFVRLPDGAMSSVILGFCATLGSAPPCLAGQRVEIDIETAADGLLRVARIIRASASAVV